MQETFNSFASKYGIKLDSDKKTSGAVKKGVGLDETDKLLEQLTEEYLAKPSKALDAKVMPV